MKVQKVSVFWTWLPLCTREPKNRRRGHYGRRYRVVHGRGSGTRSGRRVVVCAGCATSDQMAAMSPSRRRRTRRRP